MQYGPLRKKDAIEGAIRELADLDRLQVRKDAKRITLALPTTDAEREREIARARGLAREWRIEGHMGDGLPREDAEILASSEIFETLGEIVLHEAGYPPDAIAEAIALGRSSPAEMVADWLAMLERGKRSLQ